MLNHCKCDCSAFRKQMVGVSNPLAHRWQCFGIVCLALVAVGFGVSKLQVRTLANH